MTDKQWEELTEQEQKAALDEAEYEHYQQRGTQKFLLRTHPEWFEDDAMSLRAWAFGEARVVSLAHVLNVLDEEEFERVRARRAQGDPCHCPCCWLRETGELR